MGRPNRDGRVRRALFRAALVVGSVAVSGVLLELTILLLFPEYRSTQTGRAMWAYDAELGWKLRPSLDARLSFGRGHTVHVRTNTAGFRDRERALLSKQGTRRVLLLGDSFAFGYGVEAQDRVGEAIERLRPTVEVVNFGVSGYSTDQELLLFRRVASRYAADIVVLLYCSNDPEGNRASVAYGHPKPHFELRENHLELTNVPVPHTGLRLRVKYGLMRHSALYNFARIRGKELRRSLRSRSGQPTTKADSPARSDELTRQLLLQLRDEVTDIGARFLVLIATSGPDLDGEPDEARRLLRWCADQDLFCVDTRSAFEREQGSTASPPLFLDDNLHWTARGHALVAAQFVEALARKGW